MIANPKLRAYRYDPYDKSLTEEFYDHERMMRTRQNAIETSKDAEKFGLILGTLGRQGNPDVLKTIHKRIKALNKEALVILLSEIFPDKLKLFDDLDAFVQVRVRQRENFSSIDFESF